MRGNNFKRVKTAGTLAVLLAGSLLVGCNGQLPMENRTADQEAQRRGALITKTLPEYLYSRPQSLKGSLPTTTAITTDPVIFDQGPGTGTAGDCLSNQTVSQNFAEQFSFAQNMRVTGICIFTCLDPSFPPPGSTVRIKILDDDNGDPGTLLYVEDRDPDSWDLVAGVTYKVTALLATPFDADANTTYWIGLSGNGLDEFEAGIGQLAINLNTPSDGSMAQFEGASFSGHTGIGDMMFQLTGISQAPPTVTVAIDIKPGSDPNCINLGANGVVPVAILGSETFDVTTVDQATLEFEGNKARVKGKSGNIGSFDDVNNDGFTDLVAQFPVEDLDLSTSDVVGVLTGALLDGTSIEGSDTICIVPPL